MCLTLNFYFLPTSKKEEVWLYIRVSICYVCSTIIPSISVERFEMHGLFERVHYFGGSTVTKSEYDDGIAWKSRIYSKIYDLTLYVYQLLRSLWNDLENFYLYLRI